MSMELPIMTGTMTHPQAAHPTITARRSSAGSVQAGSRLIPIRTRIPRAMTWEMSTGTTQTKRAKAAAMISSTPLRSGLRPFHAHIQLLPGNDRISILYICSDNSIRIYCFKIPFYILSARQSRRCVCRSPPLILRPPAAPC